MSSFLVYRSDVLSGFLIGAIAASLTVSALLIYNRRLLVKMWWPTDSCVLNSKQALYVSRLFQPSIRRDMALVPQSREDVEMQQNHLQASAGKWLLLAGNWLGNQFRDWAQVKEGNNRHCQPFRRYIPVDYSSKILVDTFLKIHKII